MARYARALLRRREVEEEEGKGMAKLQAAGRLLVILLALFLLVVAPAQAARFTSIHLTLNYLYFRLFLSIVSLCIERLDVL
jgi:hypothetical protein